MMAAKIMSVFVIVFIFFSTCTLGLPAVSKSDCGKQFARDGRVIGGDITYYGEFPWVAAIFANNNSGYMAQRCGASIINKRWILTAAHCILENERPQDFKILVKGYKLYPAKDDKIQPVEMRVAKIILHEKYSTPDVYVNDIALMKLKEDIALDHFASPICLPPQSLNLNGKQGIVVGWGSTGRNGDNKSQYQRKVTIPIITNIQCDAWYKESGYKKYPTATSQLCAGYEQGRKDSCRGDSGGPLILKTDRGYTIVGIVSFAIGCAQPKVPGVYTRVSSYLNWINQNMQE